MDFAVPNFLLLLLAIPAIGIVFFLFARWQRRALRNFAGLQRPSLSSVQARRYVWLALLVVALGLIAFAIARPQIGSEPTSVRRQGIDLVIALDISQSMLAEDVSPNRLEAAKRELVILLERLQGHRVGLVIFAGEALMRFPLTSDIGVAQELISDLSTGDFRLEQGTAIGEAIAQSTEVFTREETPSKAILLVTDGEDQGSEPMVAVNVAVEQGIRIYTVGIGSAEGTQIPVTNPLTGQSEIKIDPITGQPAISRLDEQLLSQMGDTANGRYFGVGAGDLSLTAVADEIGRLARTTFEVSDASRPLERFQPFVLVALALLAAELLLPQGGLSPRRAKRLLIPATGLMALIAVVACDSSPSPSLNQQANERYQQGDYAGALDLYREAQIERPDLLELHYNAGNAIHRLEQYDRALDETRQALVSPDSGLLAQSYYSVGNHYFRQQRLADALEAYKNALVQDPTDFDAKYNLEVVLSLMEQPSGEPSPPPTGSPDAGSPPPDSGQPSGNPQPTSLPGEGQGQPGDGEGEPSRDGYLRTLEEALRGIESEFGVDEALRLLDILAERPMDPSRQVPPEIRPTYRDW